MSESAPDEKKSRRPGRPPLDEQKKIRNDIIKLLREGHSPSYIIHVKSYDKDTVYKYRNEYLANMKDDKDDSNMTEYETERLLLKIEIEKLIDRQKNRLEENDTYIKDYRDDDRIPPKTLLEYDLKLIDMLRSLYEQRQSLSLVPSPQEIISHARRGRKNGQH